MRAHSTAGSIRAQFATFDQNAQAASAIRERGDGHKRRMRDDLDFGHDAIPRVNSFGLPPHDVLRHGTAHPVVVGIPGERAAEIVKEPTGHSCQLAGGPPSLPHVPDGQAVAMENEFRQHDTSISLDGPGRAAAGNDFERAERLIEGNGIPLHLRGAVTLILDWLGSLPATVLNARPWLWWRYASLLLVNVLLHSVGGLAVMRLSLGDILTKPGFIGLMLGLLLFVSLLAGGYPSLMMIRFRVVETLKGKISMKRKSPLRSGLIVLQFVIACVMISCTYIIYQQYRYMAHADLGIAREVLISVPLHSPDKGREIVAVETPLGAVRFKIARRGGRIVNATPEFDDCAKLAAANNLSVKEVQAMAIQAYGVSHS